MFKKKVTQKGHFSARSDIKSVIKSDGHFYTRRGALAEKQLLYNGPLTISPQQSCSVRLDRLRQWSLCSQVIINIHVCIHVQVVM